MQVIIRKEFFDDVSFVPKANDKFVEAELRINLHDVPNDRAPTDLDHRLGPNFRLLGKAASQTAREDHHLADLHTCPTYPTMLSALPKHCGV